jgi:hypothetical protein
MKNFPWLEAALIVALAVALIVRPHKQEAAADVATQPSYTSVLGSN